MAKENNKMEVVNESPKKSVISDSDLELVFGSKPGDIELINNEKNGGKYNGISSKGSDHSALPLLEPYGPKQLPPLAGPEIDDLDGDKPAKGGSYPGIDDGLLDSNDNKTHFVDVGDDELDDKSEPETRDDAVGTEDDNHLTPRFGTDDRPISPVPSTIDVNTYQQKKNLAQGMMDLALLSANANQLRYVIESGGNHPYYIPSLVFISLSVIFQIAVGVGLIMNSRYDVNDKKEICKADKINNLTVLGIFLITIVNVFITSFSVATQTPPQ